MRENRTHGSEGGAGKLVPTPIFKRTHKSGSTYQVWEEGSHPQFIESEAVMRQKMEYIHYNPVARGYVDRPEHWRYSSVHIPRESGHPFRRKMGTDSKRKWARGIIWGNRD